MRAPCTVLFALHRHSLDLPANLPPTCLFVVLPTRARCTDVTRSVRSKCPATVTNVSMFSVLGGTVIAKWLLSARADTCPDLLGASHHLVRLCSALPVITSTGSMLVATRGTLIRTNSLSLPLIMSLVAECQCPVQQRGSSSAVCLSPIR